MWLAGGPVKGGQAIGETDILHLMGLDYSRLSYFYNGLDQTLIGTERKARLIEDALA